MSGPTRRAVVSVSDKTGVVEFCRALSEMGFEIVSTGGTARELEAAGIPVKQVAAVAGFPEILDGRVKTLQPRIHGGILAVRDSEEHMRQVKEHDIPLIDLVAVNLYPFAEVVSRPEATLSEAIENIDIGGPTMIRAAAKNYRHVICATNPGQYPGIIAGLREGGLDEEARLELGRAAFAHTAAYDALIAAYLAGRLGRGPLDLEEDVTLRLNRVATLRYGENPHQRAAFYAQPLSAGPRIAAAEQLGGKELSFNNINDADAALACVLDFAAPTAVALKHTNPCGVASARDLAAAFKRCYEADPVSIFGGIVAVNRPVDRDTAAQMAQIFLEVIIAPDFQPEALEILGQKTGLRLLRLPGMAAGGGREAVDREAVDLKRVAGGYLLQDRDALSDDEDSWETVTRRSPSERAWRDLSFAWRVVRHVKSNAIVLALGERTCGVGAGQMNRIEAAHIALRQAGEQARSSALASDAFFPFPDVVEAAAAAGVEAIIQPGGAKRDEEVVRRANDLGLAMVFTGRRHFKH